MAFTYFRVFFATMRREWFGIDRLRLDKFMMLVRKFVQQSFVHLRNADWCADAFGRTSKAVTLLHELRSSGRACRSACMPYEAHTCPVQQWLVSTSCLQLSPALHCRDAQRVEPFVDALTEEVLLKEEGPPALGLVYHLAGLWRDAAACDAACRRTVQVLAGWRRCGPSQA